MPRSVLVSGILLAGAKPVLAGWAAAFPATWDQTRWAAVGGSALLVVLLVFASVAPGRASAARRAGILWALTAGLVLGLTKLWVVRVNALIAADGYDTDAVGTGDPWLTHLGGGGGYETVRWTMDVDGWTAVRLAAIALVVGCVAVLLREVRVSGRRGVRAASLVVALAAAGGLLVVVESSWAGAGVSCCWSAWAWWATRAGSQT